MENFAQLEDIAWRYYDLDQQIKSLTKEKDELNANIKQEMASQGLDKCTVGNYNISVSVQSRKKLNDDRLLDKLRKLDIPGTIKTIEVPDEQAVEDAIYEGKLPAETLTSCIDITPVQVLKVSMKKQSKGGNKNGEG